MSFKSYFGKVVGAPDHMLSASYGQRYVQQEDC